MALWSPPASTSKSLGISKREDGNHKSGPSKPVFSLKTAPWFLPSCHFCMALQNPSQILLQSEPCLQGPSINTFSFKYYITVLSPIRSPTWQIIQPLNPHPPASQPTTPSEALKLPVTSLRTTLCDLGQSWHLSASQGCAEERKMEQHQSSFTKGRIKHEVSSEIPFPSWMPCLRLLLPNALPSKIVPQASFLSQNCFLSPELHFLPVSSTISLFY